MRVVVYNVIGNDAWRAVAQTGAARAKRLMATHVSWNLGTTKACRRLAAQIPDALCGDPDAIVDYAIEERLGRITMTFMALKNYAVFRIDSGGFLEAVAFWG